ncbi:MAG: transcriptional regulator NrdR [Verrucomicrobiota bacterium]
MRCVQCGSLKDKVLDSRSSKDGTSIRRRRECLACSYRYTTYEQIERTELRVVKRDGTRQAINREKIMGGLIKACEKRPVTMDRLERAVEEILTSLHKDHLSEVPSSAIGAKVMDKLHQIDPVAYVRYVSVYRQFEDVNEFIQEIQTLSRRASTSKDPFQRRLFKD